MKLKYFKIGIISISALAILLILTNPSIEDFKGYLPSEKPLPTADYDTYDFYKRYTTSHSRKINYIIYSIYERVDTDRGYGDSYTERYYGFLNNFYFKEGIVRIYK
jgi:hypothetical protein